MLKKGFKINDFELTSAQKNILRIVHSQLSDVFNEDIPSHISQHVSNHLDRALNGSRDNLKNMWLQETIILLLD